MDAVRVGSCLRRNDGGGAGMTEGTQETEGARGGWGRERAWRWARRDTRGKRGYDGVGDGVAVRAAAEAAAD